MKDTTLCGGCRDNFYNHPGEHGSKECWSLKAARVVKRWRLGWWTTPTTPRAFQQVKTYSCHHAPGKYAHSEKLPDFAVDPIYLKRAALTPKA